MGNGLEVEFQAMDTAAAALRSPVTTLTDGRQVLLARMLSGAAFGGLDASRQAADGHAAVVADNAGRLAGASGRLTEIIGGIGTTRGAFRDWDARKAAEQRAQQAQLQQPDGGQRDKALATLREIAEREPISTAAVAKRPLESFTGWLSWSDTLRNFQAGQIGDHYADEAYDLLSQPPTNENLRRLADTETGFWNSDRGSTVGSWASADWRYDMLIDARTDWLAEFEPAERARIAARLGL